MKKIFEIPAGTMVHIGGVPAEIIQPVWVEAEPQNARVIQSRLPSPTPTVDDRRICAYSGCRSTAAENHTLCEAHRELSASPTKASP